MCSIRYTGSPPAVWTALNTTNRVTSPEPETAESEEVHANDGRFFSLLKDDVKIPSRTQSLRSSSGEVSLIRAFQTL